MRNIVQYLREIPSKESEQVETLHVHLFNFVTIRRKSLSILSTFHLLLLQLQFNMTYFLQASYNHMKW